MIEIIDKIQECGLIIGEGNKIVHFNYEMFSKAMTDQFNELRDLRAENRRLMALVNSHTDDS